MHIESSEHLRPWLVKELTPISDADPVPLARYVMALLKKDMDTPQLRAFCEEQLDVFLGKSTSSFVDKLFVVVPSNQYLPVDYVPKKKKGKSESKSKDDTKAAKKKEESRQESASVTSTTSRNDAKSRTRAETRTDEKAHERMIQSTKSAEDAKSASRDKTRSTTAAVDMRSRSPPRASHSRPEGRAIHGVDAVQKHETSKSEMPAEGRQQVRDDETRRSRSPILPSRSTVVPVKPSVHSRLGPRIESERKRVEAPPLLGELRQQEARGIVRRIVNEHATIQQAKKRHMEELSSGDEEDERPREKKQTKQRCRDFDEKGYCMKGNECPFDHGLSVVIVKDIDEVMPLNKRIVPSSGSIDAPPPPGVETPGDIASMYAAPGAVPVPMNFSRPPPGYPAFTGITANGTTAPMWSGGATKAAAQRQARNNTIILTQIPEEKNKIALLDEYFKNFGDVSNIKVRHNNRSDCALVTFTDANCAAAAMSNPAAILGNRFIRMTWYDPQKDEKPPESGKWRQKARVAMSANGNLIKTVYNPKARAAHKVASKYGVRATPYTPRAASGTVSNEPMRKESKKTSVKELKQMLAAEQHMLDTNLEMYKSCITQLAEKTLDKEKRNSILEMAKQTEARMDQLRATIKSTEEKIEELTKAERSVAPPASAPAAVEEKGEKATEEPKTEEEKLRQRMLQLQAQIKSMTERPTTTSGAPRGRGGYRGGRGAYRGRRLAPPSVAALDKRPRTLLITGVSVNDKDALLAYMEKFGAISSVDFGGKDGSLRAHITYRNRRDAETAKETAGEVNGQKLEIRWDTPNDTGTAIPDSERPPDKRLSASQILQSLGDDDELSDGEKQARHLAGAEEDDYLLDDDTFDQSSKYMPPARIVNIGTGSDDDGEAQ